MRRTIVGLAALAVATSIAGQAGASVHSDRSHLTAHQRQALAAGLQVAPKGSAAAAAKPGGTASRPNPYLAFYADRTKADYSYWAKQMNAAAKKRASSVDLAANRRAALGTNVALPPAIVHDEEEPDGTSGSNDSVANSERVPEFGTAAGKNHRVRILGALADLSEPADAIDPFPEDNGSIPLAGDTGIDGEGVVETSDVLGDGPHGTVTGDGSNDFDFYKLDADAGLRLVASTAGSDLDTVVALYDAEGTILALDDDGGDGLTSLLTFPVTESGTYYLLVAGFSSDGTLPDDPMDSGSGAGGADEGDYDLSLGVSEVDLDFYSVRLRAGDVLGGVANGGADGLIVFKSDGSQRVGAEGVDASSIYAPESPLPGGGNTTFAYVAEESGWYSVQATGDAAAYDLLLEAYRPGTEAQKPRTLQTVFLDFDGERVNTGVWRGPGVRDLSPFSAFIPKWGLTKSQEGALVHAITKEVRENLRKDMIAKGLNKRFDLQVVNSRHSPDVFGRSNVSRVIVGGTIDESGLETIGVAQYIDPGNYGLEDQAVVLLDLLSDSSGGPVSLNTYMDGTSDRAAFVSQAVGNVVSHEAGHLIGNYHTDNASPTVNLEDSGGDNFDKLYGVGADGIGGTADDADVDFTTDDFDPFEGFTGLENSLNTSAWAYVFHLNL